MELRIETNKFNAVVRTPLRYHYQYLPRTYIQKYLRAWPPVLVLVGTLECLTRPYPWADGRGQIVAKSVLFSIEMGEKRQHGAFSMPSATHPVQSNRLARLLE